MKKMLNFFLLSVFVLGMAFAFVSFTTVPLEAVDGDGPVIDSGSGGGAGTAIYVKSRERCPNDPKKMEYSCDAYGKEQCKVQNC